MSRRPRTTLPDPPRRTRSAVRLWGLLGLSVVGAACGGPGFSGYEQLYPEAPDASQPGEPWQGAETVRVARARQERTVALAGLAVVDLAGAPALPLPALVAAAALTDTPQDFRYDLTASDGYDLLRKRGDPAKLPSWDELQLGVLYRHPQGDLRVAWDRERQPWGSALSAYQVKYMDGGLITLLPPAEE